MILHKEFGDRSLELGVYSGTTTPLHTNATGKAILAFLPDERTDEILDAHGLPQVTEQTITDEALLRSELATIREEGTPSIGTNRSREWASLGRRSPSMSG